MKMSLAAVFIALAIAVPVRSQEAKPVCRKANRGGSC